LEAGGAYLPILKKLIKESNPPFRGIKRGVLLTESLAAIRVRREAKTIIDLCF
jgi:hypothetical protein